ncbi:uncharacterized protein TA16155 [Theileria annulata]|uniref:Histidine kinase/HSP90-like ATPase domain-containing protein n=1 Tax=Theileria annulata TaxID=5874 RepID=Q4UIR2_THEAN|nr:uncharacterized protein TA16155 [Theileria annulata]CAI73027.1 hypothetical protein TA16155 [Theileria annulata]|eukprot:XP_953705.1 hypothetical protein TA16155 [Theileria annulata]
MKEVYQFFSENLGLTGFDEKSVLYTISKELIENAIDACKDEQKEHKIKLQLKKNDDVIEIQCFDDGSGINPNSIESIGHIFNSSKSDQETSGTFGLGINENMIMKYNVVLSEDLKEPFVCNVLTEEVTLDEWPYNTGVITKFKCSVPNNFKELISSYLDIVSIHHPKINISLDMFGNLISKGNKQESITEGILSVFLSGVEIYTASFTTDQVGFKKVDVSCFIGKFSLKFKNYATLHVLRCINGIPMAKNSSSYCAIYSTIRNLIKKELKEYGIRSSGRISKQLMEELDSQVNTPEGVLNHKPVRTHHLTMFSFLGTFQLKLHQILLGT